MKYYYQPKGGKKGKYALRENTYRRIWYLIADYPYFKAVQRGHSDAEEFSKVNNYSVAERQFDYEPEREQFERYVAAIENAQKQIPEEYVGYIMDHIVNRMKYKDMRGVSERILKIWAQRFIWHVAHNLGDA